MSKASAIGQRVWNYCNVLRGDSLEDTTSLPHPDVLALEMIEDLEAALEQLREIAEDVGEANGVTL